MNRRFKADWEEVEVGDEYVIIRDLDLGNRSVTNDAEGVVAELYEKYGNKRFFYYDSDGQCDELRRAGEVFLGFHFGCPYLQKG